MKRTRLRAKPRERLSPEEHRLAGLWFALVTYDKCCAVCGAQQGDLIPGMHGLQVRIQAHHVIEKARLKALARERGVPTVGLIYDPRIGMPVCAYPCHDRHTKRSKPIPLSKVPKAALAMADELGLRWYVEQTYSR